MLQRQFPRVLFWTVAATLVLANTAHAYVGPGAGMEFIQYAMGLVAMVGVAFLSFLLWPFFSLMRWLRGSKGKPATDPAAAPATAAESAPPAPPGVQTEAGSTPPSVP